MLWNKETEVSQEGTKQLAQGAPHRSISLVSIHPANTLLSTNILLQVHNITVSSVRGVSKSIKPLPVVSNV